jgi:hypothetical protein
VISRGFAPPRAALRRALRRGLRELRMREMRSAASEPETGTGGGNRARASTVVHGVSRGRFLFYALLPLWLVPLLFVAVVESSGALPLARGHIPDEPYRPDRCTWYCHNHGCRHRPALPAFFAGDDGLFGATVRALHAAGRSFGPDASGAGYGAANLAVFCAAWPGAMYALYLVALRQRAQLVAAKIAAKRSTRC